MILMMMRFVMLMRWLVVKMIQHVTLMRLQQIQVLVYIYLKENVIVKHVLAKQMVVE
jgi:hypothetical protein